MGIAKALFVGTTANIAGTTTLAGVTATSITDSGLTSGRVTYAGTAGLLQDSANLTFSGSALAVTGTLSATGTVTAGKMVLTGGASTTLLSAVITDNDTDLKFGASGSGTTKNTKFYTDGFGTLAMTLDSSGNLGLGGTPSAWSGGLSVLQLNVSGSVSSGLSGNGTYLAQNWYYDSAEKFVGNGYALLYEQNKSVGIHSWSRSSITNVSGAGAAATMVSLMRLDASGTLLVGVTSNPGGSYGGEILVASNGSNAVYFSTTATAGSGVAVTSGRSSNGFQHAFFQSGTKLGDISTNGSATSYNTASDYRLKENVQPMIGALAKVALLKPCTYKWKSDGSDGEGFIAHELSEVVPQCVTGEKDAVDEEGNPNNQGIDTSFLVATLTAALQEAHGLIKDLTTRITALENK